MLAQFEHDGSDLTDAHRAADRALVGLRRAGLIRSWQTDDGGYAVLVGRGTVRLPFLDVAGVVQFAAVLHRDKVSVVRPGYPIGHRTIRYRLSDGRFADRHDSRAARYLDQYRYTVYLPGGDRSGCAARQFAAWTVAEAVALAGLTRIRGRCHRCRSVRPLHVDRWRPDPTIPCPGCGADETTPVTLLCHRCATPIQPVPPEAEPLRIAWRHLASGAPDCDDSPATRRS
ncbi:hypothetical protein [Actinophytocola sp.]|uniref:hypothetical protein n=1 Tax=Actinophytocola sp. TaxID=1872138 RepID=UPI002D7EC86E|nr:hypothetical protein [Actinophytocola sp.]HET9144023.1 hypothetical protein [Actinophytocola sp.]